jgi:CRP/FNR family transcriptional regulator
MIQIDPNILIAWGGVSKVYKKNEIVFFEENTARFYHQVMNGCIKMSSLSSEGKEFIQGIFKTGESFGEPPLFLGETYPATATALEDSVVIKLSKDSLFKILEAYPNIQLDLLKVFARRIFNKTKTNCAIVNNDPKHRIMGFLMSFKKENPIENGRSKIPFTRQEIANFTGLRVETVIRTLVKMEKEKLVEIKDRKLYY